MVVDEERGLVFGFFLFHVPGTREDRSTLPATVRSLCRRPILRPPRIDVAELFKIKNGKIRKVEALQTNVPYGTPSPFCERNAILVRERPSQAARLIESAIAHAWRVSSTNISTPWWRTIRRTCRHAHAQVHRRRRRAQTGRRAVGNGQRARRHTRSISTILKKAKSAFFGTMKENGNGIALALRLKIENRRISEAESVVVRSPRTFDMMEKAGAPDPMLLETVPISERLSRTQLTAIANQYFEAIEQGNGKVAPFDADCNRFENGMKTSGALGCSAQLDTQVFNYISRIFPRRFLVVDPDRQVVFGFFMFNHRGDVLWVNTPGRREARHDGRRQASLQRGCRRGLSHQGRQDPQGGSADDGAALRREVPVRSAGIASPSIGLAFVPPVAVTQGRILGMVQPNLQAFWI